LTQVRQAPNVVQIDDTWLLENRRENSTEMFDTGSRNLKPATKKVMPVRE